MIEDSEAPALWLCSTKLAMAGYGNGAGHVEPPLFTAY